jgi:hypothetical protein
MDGVGRPEVDMPLLLSTFHDLVGGRGVDMEGKLRQCADDLVDVCRLWRLSG